MAQDVQIVLDVVSNVLFVAALVIAGCALIKIRGRIEQEKADIIALANSQAEAPEPEHESGEERDERLRRESEEYERRGLRVGDYTSPLTQRQDAELTVIDYLKPTWQAAFVLAALGALFGLAAAIAGICAR